MSALARRASLRRSGVPGSVLGVDVGVEFAGEGRDEGGVGGDVETDAQHRDLALAPLQQQPGAVGALQSEGRQASAAGEVLELELLWVLGQQVRARRRDLLLGDLLGLDLRRPPVVQLGRPLAVTTRSCTIRVMLSSRARSLSKS